MNSKSKQKLVALSISLLFVLTYPFVTIANKSQYSGLIPPLYVYIFFVWLVTIVFIYFITEVKK